MPYPESTPTPLAAHRDSTPVLLLVDETAVLFGGVSRSGESAFTALAREIVAKGRAR